MNPEVAHFELVCPATGKTMTEQDAMVWMVLMHTHVILLRSDAVAESWARFAQEGVVRLLPDTQRGAAATIARLWSNIKRKRGREEDERADYMFWYIKFNKETPYEVADSIPHPLCDRVQEFRNRLLNDPRIIDVFPDD